jgi:hypothetical protein
MKIPVKRLAKKDAIAELTEATKADQAQSRREGDLRHVEMMEELSNRKMRDDQRHTEKMLDKQIELRKLDLRLEKERTKNRNRSQAAIFGGPSVVLISSTSTPGTASQAGSPAVQSSTLPDALTGIRSFEVFGVEDPKTQFSEVGFMPFNTNNLL